MSRGQERHQLSCLWMMTVAAGDYKMAVNDVVAAGVVGVDYVMLVVIDGETGRELGVSKL